MARAPRPAIGSAGRSSAGPHLSVVRTLPVDVDRVVEAALDMVPFDLTDVAINVKRHGIKRVWFTQCWRPDCPLRHNADESYVEGAAVGPGHLYRRKRDLELCRGGSRIVPLDRTRYWVSGRAYDGVPFPKSLPVGTRYLITLKVPQVVAEGQLPAERTYHRAKTAGPTRIALPEADIAFVLGHELRHIQQFRDGLPRSEVDAELAGRDLLYRWVDAERPGLWI